jgi:hypothetical protein
VKQTSDPALLHVNFTRGFQPLTCAALVFASSFIAIPQKMAVAQEVATPPVAAPTTPEDTAPIKPQTDETAPTQPEVPNLDGSTPQGRGTVPVPAEAAVEAKAEEEEPVVRGFKFGADLYYGISNKPGSKRYRDGAWLGAGPSYPATVYGRWQTPKGSAARVSVSVGELFNGSIPYFEQPVEAWYMRPVGKYQVTAGKFYVPFGQWEWEYESKWGAMITGKAGKADFSASLNYNPNLDSINAFGRITQAVNKNLTLGVSLGAGRGFSFDTVHDKGLGLEATYVWKGFQLNSEYVLLEKRKSDRFQFAFARLSYTKLGKFAPYVSRHTWFDKADEQGNYNCSTVGFTYELKKGLTVESAYARPGDHSSVSWIQLHYAFEL